jgi:hypothetical protein
MRGGVGWGGVGWGGVGWGGVGWGGVGRGGVGRALAGAHASGQAEAAGSTLGPPPPFLDPWHRCCRTTQAVPAAPAPPPPHLVGAEGDGGLEAGRQLGRLVGVDKIVLDGADVHAPAHDARVAGPVGVVAGARVRGVAGVDHRAAGRGLVAGAGLQLGVGADVAVGARPAAAARDVGEGGGQGGGRPGSGVAARVCEQARRRRVAGVAVPRDAAVEAARRACPWRRAGRGLG